MKELILKILLEKTQIEGRYIGGDHIDIIVFKNSEECDLESFLSSIANEIASELEKELIQLIKYVKEVHTDKYGNLQICDSGGEFDPTIEKVVKQYINSKQK